jgi:hypothetical protein
LDVAYAFRQALADRYAIERELAQGGMATVNFARDLCNTDSTPRDIPLTA